LRRKWSTYPRKSPKTSKKSPCRARTSAKELKKIRGKEGMLGVLRHCTDMEVEWQYADTHGASIFGFAFAHMLDFEPMPRRTGPIRASGEVVGGCIGRPVVRGIGSDTQSLRYVMYCTMVVVIRV
jgi:hypothetical protein